MASHLRIDIPTATVAPPPSSPRTTLTVTVLPSLITKTGSSNTTIGITVISKMNALDNEIHVCRQICLPNKEIRLNI